MEDATALPQRSSMSGGAGRLARQGLNNKKRKGTNPFAFLPLAA
jgi:hypothetical protein